MTNGNLVKFSIALSAATAIHLGVLAYTASYSSSARVAGDGFSVQFGGVSAASPPAGASEDALAETSEAQAADTTPQKPPSQEPQPAPETPDPTPARHSEPEPASTEPAPEPKEMPPPEKPEPVPEKPDAVPETSDAAATEPAPSSAQDAPYDPPPESAPPGTKPAASGLSEPASSAASQDAESSAEEAMAASGAAAGGNSADTNYAGEVMRHLSRLRRPRASSPGSAYVSFVISASGAIDQIGISESSGSSRFDHEALAFVRKAAPFPPPPAGASGVFTVEIKGR